MNLYNPNQTVRTFMNDIKGRDYLDVIGSYFLEHGFTFRGTDKHLLYDELPPDFRKSLESLLTASQRFSEVKKKYGV